MKILVNSYPRSGTTTFVDAIRLSCSEEMLKFGEDFFHNEQWIAKSHIPVLFLGDFPSDIVVATIIRDPVDAISSNCFRWANGHTGNIVQGRIVIDKQRENKENKFDQILKDLIKHQVEQYVSYYTCLSNGSNKIKIFTYENIQLNIVKSINKVLSYTENSPINLNYDNAQNIILNPPQPTKEKTELYYNIREYIINLEQINKCYDLYHQALLRKELI